MNRSVLLVGFPILLAATGLHAESDYERGFREGYSRGYQDSQNARKSSFGTAPAAPTPAPAPRAVAGIVVVSARYGDERRSCDLTSWAAGRFNNRTSGEVDVTNDLCGDVAPGRRKSLEVEYLCHGERRSASAYEHRKLEINCF